MSEISVMAASDPYHCVICHALIKIGKMSDHREWHRNMGTREWG